MTLQDRRPTHHTTRPSRGGSSLPVVAHVVAALCLGGAGCYNYTHSDGPQPMPRLVFGTVANGAEAAISQLSYILVAIPDDREIDCHQEPIVKSTICHPVGTQPSLASLDTAFCDDNACQVDLAASAINGPGNRDSARLQLTPLSLGRATLHVTAHLTDGRITTGAASLFFVTPTRLGVSCTDGASCAPPTATVVGNGFGWIVQEWSTAEDGSEIQVAPTEIDVNIDGDAVTLDPAFAHGFDKNQGIGPGLPLQIGRWSGNVPVRLRAAKAGVATVHIKSKTLARAFDVRVVDVAELTTPELRRSLVPCGCDASPRPLGDSAIGPDTGPYTISWSDHKAYQYYLTWKLPDGSYALDANLVIESDAPPAMRLSVDALADTWADSAYDWSTIRFVYSAPGVVHFKASDGPAHAEWTMTFKTL